MFGLHTFEQRSPLRFKKRKGLREQMMLVAPEANPSEFVRRYLSYKSAAASPKTVLPRSTGDTRQS